MSERTQNRNKLRKSKKIKVGSGVIVTGLPNTYPSNGFKTGTVGTVVKIIRRPHGNNIYDVKSMNGEYKGDTLSHARKELFVL